MLNNILKLVENTVSEAISNNKQVPEAQKAQAIQATTHAVADGLKENISPDNASHIMNLFGGSSVQKSPVTGNMQSTVINALTQKAGLSQTVATSIAAAVIPMVIKAISGKVNDPQEKGFNLESLVQAFTGKGNANSGSGNDLLGKLGGLFK